MTFYTPGDEYSARNQGQIQQNPFSQGGTAPGSFSPSYGRSSGVPGIPGINYAPQPTDPWKTGWHTVVTGHEDNGGLNKALWGGHGSKNVEYRMNPWANPIADNFSNENRLGFEFANNKAALPSMGTNKAGDALPQESGSAKYGEQVPFNPQTFNDLINQINGFSDQQLWSIDTSGNYLKQFQKTAQDYSNAFANDDYRKSAEAAGWNQDTVTSWLDAAYKRLMQRLGDNYLL